MLLMSADGKCNRAADASFGSLGLGRQFVALTLFGRHLENKTKIATSVWTKFISEIEGLNLFIPFANNNINGFLLKV